MSQCEREVLFNSVNCYIKQYSIRLFRKLKTLFSKKDRNHLDDISKKVFLPKGKAVNSKKSQAQLNILLGYSNFQFITYRVEQVNLVTYSIAKGIICPKFICESFLNLSMTD